MIVWIFNLKKKKREIKGWAYKYFIMIAGADFSTQLRKYKVECKKKEGSKWILNKK